MDVRTMENILNFKEGEGQVFIECRITKKESGNGVSFNFELDTDFNEVYGDDIASLQALVISLYDLYQNEIHEDLKENDAALALAVSAIADEEGNATSTYLHYTGTYKKGSEELIKSAQAINERLTQKLNQKLDEFANVEENIKPFELIFKKQNGEYKFFDFCRLAGREIPQQKQEVSELMSLGFEQKLLDKAEEVGYNLSEIKSDQIFVAFSTDNKEIYGLKIGRFGN